MIRRGNKGFTIVELLIVITIMGILLVLGVVNLRGTQANARDEERTGDAQTIASYLESFYSQGNTTYLPGEYPSTAMVAAVTDYLVDIPSTSLIAPGQSTQSLVAATNATQTTAGVTPQPTTSQYVYQPIATDGTRCTNMATQECRKFNLYYQTEVDSTIRMIVSRHQ